MISADTARWTPPPGRHQVGMGGSMTRYLKQRRGIQQAKQNKAMPTSNYYHFKYNFMPESVDTTKPGVVELANKDITNVRVERASHQSDEVHVFRGKEEPAKEIDCVLIYDEESGIYTLEKLDSSLVLQHEGRGPPKVRPPSASPLPTTPSPAASTSKIDDDLTAELFRELESTLAKDDAEGEIDDAIPLSASTRPQASTSRKAAPTRPPPTDTTSGKPKPKLRGSAAGAASTSKPAKPSPLANPLPTFSPSKPPAPAPVPNDLGSSTSSLRKNKVSALHTVDVEEEVLEFGQPARQTKRARVSPHSGVPPMPSSLSLPGASSAATLAPPSPGGLALPSADGAVALAPALPEPPVAQDDDDDDDDDRWDVVAGVGTHAGSGAEDAGTGSIFGDAEDGEEINLDEFAAEMDQELLGGLEEEDGDGSAEDDIFGDAAYAEPQRPLKPMSLNQFAGGEAVGVDEVDDDYSSSSDDSDDD